MVPEYLALFSNTGNITIQVRFKDSDSSVSEQKIDVGEVQKLISPDGKSFISKMRFDDHLAEIEKMELFIPKNRIVLHVRLCK